MIVGKAEIKVRSLVFVSLSNRKNIKRSSGRFFYVFNFSLLKYLSAKFAFLFISAPAAKTCSYFRHNSLSNNSRFFLVD